MKKLLIFILLMIIILLVVFFFFLFGVKKESDSSHINKKKPPRPVQTIQISSVFVKPVVEVIGTIEAHHEVVVKSLAEGEIMESRMKEGEAVKKDEVLARVDDEPLKLQKEELLAQLNNTQINIKHAEREFIRSKELNKKGFLSLDDYEEKEHNLDDIRAKAKVLRATINSLDRKIRDTVITSPVRGHIARRDLERGEMITIGQTVAVIVMIEKIKVKLPVPEAEIGKVKKGLTVDFTVDSSENRVYRAHVKEITLVPSQSTGSYVVTAEADNTSPLSLLPGMIARAVIYTGKSVRQLRVPQEAVIIRNEKPFVFITHENKAVMREIKPGGFAQQSRIIISGLSENDRVIITGQYNLSDGDVITIQQDRETFK